MWFSHFFYVREFDSDNVILILYLKKFLNYFLVYGTHKTCTNLWNKTEKKQFREGEGLYISI